MQQPPDKLLRTGLVLLGAWAITFIGFLMLFAEFRTTASLSLLGRTFTGGEAALLVMVYTIALPVNLLALAIHKLFQYWRLTQQ